MDSHRQTPAVDALLIDLHELTTAASFLEHGLNERACFSLAVRRMPPRRGYLVAAGMAPLLERIENLRFDIDDIGYLESLNLFKPQFLDYLAAFRFSGTVRAMAEGTICFAEEPMLEVEAPLVEAQLLGTLVRNQIGVATLIASKAARCFGVAAGRRLIDFSLHYSPGADAGLASARSSYLAGFHGSSNVLASRLYGIPIYGTMTDSYVMAHGREREAFTHFAASFPRLSTLVIDTYDTLKGAANAAAVTRELRAGGFELQGVRLDSGNLADLSKRVRRYLDAEGITHATIFASGNLDEYGIAELVRAKAPIDAFGVGPALTVSPDVPLLDLAYKLVEYAGRPRFKGSAGKLNLPGRKQVFRASDRSGQIYFDLIGLIEETVPTVTREFRPTPDRIVELLGVRMENGRRTDSVGALAQAREEFLASFARLDQRYKALERPELYRVRYSAAQNAMLVSEKVAAAQRQQ
jgi:nicotinate phosphoribosyltransferase